MELTDAEFLAQMTAKLPIDMNDLEGEWNRQPGMYMEVGEWCALLRREAKAAKQHAEFVYSRIQQDVMNDPNHGGLAKTTVDMVKAYITTHHEYRDALVEANDAEMVATQAQKLLEAMEMRKSALRDLVRLYVHEYFMDSDPKGPSPQERRSGPGRFEDADAELQSRRESRRSRRLDQDAQDDELEENRNG